MKVLSLCDLTGTFVQPWVDNGYEAVLVDPQHGFVSYDGAITRLPLTVGQALEEIRALEDVVFVAGFPPCTDLAVSGARWFDKKSGEDPYFQAKAVRVVEQCRTVGEMLGCPWFFENPVSVLSSIYGPPDHTFHPWEFTSLAPEDNYTKKTCLWTGGGFQMPDPCPDLSLGEPDNRIHRAAPGPERANFRSATPKGFSEAVFNANRKRT